MNTSELREALHRDAELAGLPPTDLVHRVAGLRRRSRRRRASVLAGVVAIAVGVAGVAVLDGAREQDRGDDTVADGSGAAQAVVDPEAAAQQYRELLGTTGSAASRAIGPASLVEFLPTITYAVRNGNTTTLSDSVVVGHVTDVRPGRAFYVPEDDDTASTEVPFDDPRAQWRTVHAEVAVTEVLAGQVPPDPLVVGLALNPRTPVEVVADGLPALGDLVLFLDADAGVFDDDPGIWSIAFDGEVLAEVGDDGRLSLPAAESYVAERWLAGTPTLDSLREAARQPARTVPFETLED
ncbi:hypothetical protein JKP75_16990 [Blastococcus sp. TML/M2B]|uniref:hypothetical protein n=1 Tax=unclassified Blastococcus TaxID=2619396 RepID=UPI00190C39D0|nr:MULTISPECIES: hypothetical protein [unclassified Blastococcus]MBN1094099.1 hypothetical protein [Blastococcus sp. TML/M2B]MBN1095781.1 hypothetical protein [Blastococcus sp. TML/C7B]